MYFYIFLTHGDLGKTLLRTAENIMDENIAERCAVFSMDYSMAGALDKVKEDIKVSVEKAKSAGYKVVIFVDIFGGSPSNVAFTIPRQENLDVVSGVNLAMVMYAIEHIDSKKNIELIVSGLLNTGLQNITSAEKLLGENIRKGTKQ